MKFVFATDNKCQPAQVENQAILALEISDRYQEILSSGVQCDEMMTCIENMQFALNTIQNHGMEGLRILDADGSIEAFLGNVTSAEAAVEGFVDKIKEAITWLIDKIKEWWGNIKKWISSLRGSDSSKIESLKTELKDIAAGKEASTESTHIEGTGEDATVTAPKIYFVATNFKDLCREAHDILPKTKKIASEFGSLVDPLSNEIKIMVGKVKELDEHAKQGLTPQEIEQVNKRIEELSDTDTQIAMLTEEISRISNALNDTATKKLSDVHIEDNLLQSASNDLCRYLEKCSTSIQYINAFERNIDRFEVILKELETGVTRAGEECQKAAPITLKYIRGALNASVKTINLQKSAVVLGEKLAEEFIDFYHTLKKAKRSA